LLERAVSSLESRFASRGLRGTAGYRHLLTPEFLKESITKWVFDADLKKLLGDVLKVQPDSAAIQPVPEVEIFIGLLVVFYLLDQKSFDLVSWNNSRVPKPAEIYWKESNH
jgi:hypothetical protein